MPSNKFSQFSHEEKQLMYSALISYRNGIARQKIELSQKTDLPFWERTEAANELQYKINGINKLCAQCALSTNTKTRKP